MALGLSSMVSTGATLAVGKALLLDDVTIGASTGVREVIAIGAPTAGSSALCSTADPLPVYLQGSTAVVTIQGNSSVVISGNSTAIISTASIIRVDPPATWPDSSVTIKGGQSSVTISGAVGVTDNAGSLTVDFSTNSTTDVIITAGTNSTATPVYVISKPWSLFGASTWASVKLTSTALTTLFSSAASTRFNVTDLVVTNAGTAETVFTLYDGSTSGTVLFQSDLSSAGGGFSINFGAARRGSSGNAIKIECVPASTVYINAGAYKTA
jgi:hypothetical protein